MTIGERIKEVRFELEISSTKLANKINIPVRTIGSYERNESTPGIKFLSAMNEQLNVNLNWLITGRGNMFSDMDKRISEKELNDYSKRYNFNEKEMHSLFRLLENSSAKEMVMKFISIKEGNREAIDELIQNLNGIKAICG